MEVGPHLIHGHTMCLLQLQQVLLPEDLAVEVRVASCDMAPKEQVTCPQQILAPPRQHKRVMAIGSIT